VALTARRGPFERPARPAILVDRVGLQPREDIDSAGGRPDIGALEKALTIERRREIGILCHADARAKRTHGMRLRPYLV